VQDGKGAVAQGAMRRPGRDHGRLADREKMRAGGKVACCQALVQEPVEPHIIDLGLPPRA